MGCHTGLGLLHRSHLFRSGWRRSVVATASGLAGLAALEHLDSFDQILGLRFQTARRRRHLLYQGRILLRRLVHLSHRFADLRNCAGLVGTGGANFSHDVRHLLDATHHFCHGGACIVHQLTTTLDPLYASTNQRLNFFGG